MMIDVDTSFSFMIESNGNITFIVDMIKSDDKNKSIKDDSKRIQVYAGLNIEAAILSLYELDDFIGRERSCVKFLVESSNNKISEKFLQDSIENVLYLID